MSKTFIRKEFGSCVLTDNTEKPCSPEESDKGRVSVYMAER
jgi:hypothetical protein